MSRRSLHCDAQTFPIEIWGEVLRFATSIETDISLSDDEDGRLLETKMALTLVCQDWRAIATKYLYARVVIYSYRSLQSLMYTLEQSDRDSIEGCSGDRPVTRGYSWWTTEIIRYNVVFSTAAATLLGRAIKHCVNLQRYSVRGKHYEHPPLTFAVLANLSPSFTSIEWGANVSMAGELLIPLLKACPGLAHLGLGALWMPSHPESVELEGILLLNLRRLAVPVAERWPVLQMISTWTLPSLKGMRFTELTGLTRYPAALRDFAKAHAPSILSLSISTSSIIIREPLDTPSVLTLFPNLRHVTLQLGRFMHFDNTPSPASTTLIERVDIFGLPNGGGKLMPIWWDAELMNRYFNAFLGPIFPVLKEVRLRDIDVTKVRISWVEEDDSGAWWRVSLPERRVKWWNEEVVGRFKSVGVRLDDVNGCLIPEVRTANQGA